VIEHWLTAIRDHPERPPPMQRHVLAMLGLRMDWATGRGFASTQQLGADSDASKATIVRATMWARGAAFLVQTRRGHRLGNGQAAASEWQLTQGLTHDTLNSQGLNGHASRSQQGDLKVSPETHHQESSTSQSSSSPRARAAGIIRGAFPDAADEEIEAITENIKNAHQPRNLPAYIASLAAGGDLRLPCDVAAAGAHSEACRSGDSSLCVWSWCSCRCHVKVAAP
jgi:hypothetical protein